MSDFSILDYPGQAATERRPGAIEVSLERIPRGSESEQHLLWREIPGERARRPRHEKEFLSRFVALGDATPETILAFARDFGVLYTCQHHVPSGSPGHDPYPLRPDPRLVASECEPTKKEPLWLWRAYALEAAALRELVDSVRAGEHGTAEAWARFWICRYARADRRLADARTGRELDVEAVIERTRHNLETRPEYPDALRAFLARQLNEWLDLGASRLRVQWRSKGPPRLTYGGVGVLPAVARSLVQRAAGVKSTSKVPLCDNEDCRQPVVATSRKGGPKTGGSYCKECSDDKLLVARLNRRRRRAELRDWP